MTVMVIHNLYVDIGTERFCMDSSEGQFREK